jgi:hypothetical protein
VSKPTAKKPKRSFRSERPERLVLGGEEMVRNDVLANDLHTSVHAIDSGDRDGAPYIKLFGIKYRPLRLYHEYLLRQIRVCTQPPPPNEQATSPA